MASRSALLFTRRAQCTMEAMSVPPWFAMTFFSMATRAQPGLLSTDKPDLFLLKTGSK